MKTAILCVLGLAFAPSACRGDDRALASGSGGRGGTTGGSETAGRDTASGSGGTTGVATGAAGADAKCGGDFFREGEGGTPPGVIITPTGGRMQLPIGGRATGGAPCSRGVVRYEYPPDAPRVTCESCGCGPATADDCASVDCKQGAPIYPCTEADREEVPAKYEFEVWSNFVELRTLELKIQTEGGCEPHAVSLCFDPVFIETDAVQATLRLRHEITGDQRCEALKYQTVRFDLTPLLDHYSALYATYTGVIATNYGLIGFGDTSCNERSRIAYDHVQRLIAGADTACQTEADCTLVRTQTGCNGGFEVAVASSAARALRDQIEQISVMVCEDFCYFEDLDSCALGAVRCEAGACKGSGS
jgi:hypothetical protein